MRAKWRLCWIFCNPTFYLGFRISLITYLSDTLSAKSACHRVWKLVLCVRGYESRDHVKEHLLLLQTAGEQTCCSSPSVLVQYHVDSNTAGRPQSYKTPHTYYTCTNMPGTCTHLCPLNLHLSDCIHAVQWSCPFLALTRLQMKMTDLISAFLVRSSRTHPMLCWWRPWYVRWKTSANAASLDMPSFCTIHKDTTSPLQSCGLS